MKNKVCQECDNQLEEAWINFGVSVLLLEVPKKGTKHDTTRITVYVCPKCGRVELFANEPEIFNKQS